MKEMKKFLMMLLVVAVPMTLASCSDDDDPVVEDLAPAVVGDYEGEIVVKELENQKAVAEIEITRSGVNNIKISFDDITVSDITAEIGDITGLSLTGTDKSATIVKETKKVNIKIPALVEQSEGLIPAAGINLDVEVSGTIVNGVLKLDLGVDTSLLSVLPNVPEKLTLSVSAEKVVDDEGDNDGDDDNDDNDGDDDNDDNDDNEDNGDGPVVGEE